MQEIEAKRPEFKVSLNAWRDCLKKKKKEGKLLEENNICQLYPDLSLPGYLL